MELAAKKSGYIGIGPRTVVTYAPGLDDDDDDGKQMESSKGDYFWLRLHGSTARAESST